MQTLPHELLDTHAAGEPVARLNNRALDGLLGRPPAVVTMTPLPGGDPAKGRV